MAALGGDVLVLDEGRVLFAGTVEGLCGVPEGRSVSGPAIEEGYLSLLTGDGRGTTER